MYEPKMNPRADNLLLLTTMRTLQIFESLYLDFGK